MSDDPGLLEFALAAARAAGDVLLEHFEGKLTISTKSSDIDLVTSADRAAEATLTDRFTRAHPSHWILAE